jgi:hypothetical protein
LPADGRLDPSASSSADGRPDPGASSSADGRPDPGASALPADGRLDPSASSSADGRPDPSASASANGRPDPSASLTIAQEHQDLVDASSSRHHFPTRLYPDHIDLNDALVFAHAPDIAPSPIGLLIKRYQSSLYPYHVDTLESDAVRNPLPYHVDTLESDAVRNPLPYHVDTLESDAVENPLPYHVDTLESDAVENPLPYHVDTLESDAVGNPRTIESGSGLPPDHFGACFSGSPGAEEDIFTLDDLSRVWELMCRSALYDVRCYAFRFYLNYARLLGIDHNDHHRVAFIAVPSEKYDQFSRFCLPQLEEVLQRRYHCSVRVEVLR